MTNLKTYELIQIVLDEVFELGIKRQHIKIQLYKTTSILPIFHIQHHLLGWCKHNHNFDP